MNAVNWFEIPVIDFDRAAKFYEAIFGITMHRQEFLGDLNGFFQYTNPGGVGGCILKVDNNQPSDKGTLVYLNAETPSKLETILSRVEAAGGQIVTPTLDIGDPGVMAIIRDTEGNRVGLHAPHAA